MRLERVLLHMRGMATRLTRIAWILLLLVVVAPGVAHAGRVVVLELRDSIQPASLRYLERGLRDASASGADLVIIELDTPGGLVTSMRSMVSAILGSKTPVAVYVTPSGARAASAGFFLLLAADVAAMTPGTNAGAAHPVVIGQQPKDDDDVPSEKMTEDAAALARALAVMRGRPADWAERAIRDSRAYTADEAKEYGLIDKVAPSRDALLRELDGTTIKRPDGTTGSLSLRTPEVSVLERTFAERVLSVIADPQIAYLLLMIGALCLAIELMNPGIFVAGIVGALAVLVGVYGFSLLPVSWVGALLIAAAIGLLVAEVFVTSHGLLTIGGLASFVIGSLMLVDAPIPELRIGIELVLPVAIVIAGVMVLLVTRAIRSRKLVPQSGVDAMRGELGQVVREIESAHDGIVFVHGEYWTATAPRPLSIGAEVRVEAVDGLRLYVTPVPRTGEIK